MLEVKWEGHKFEASLGYRARCYLKKRNKTNRYSTKNKALTA
jgi:hypothetical protein